MKGKDTDKIIWLEQTPPSTSDLSSTLQNTEAQTILLNLTGQMNPSSITIDALKQSSTADFIWKELNQNDENETIKSTLKNINKTPSIKVEFNADSTIESVEKPNIFPDTKEWAFFEYTDSSRADDEMDDEIDDADDDGSLMTLATTASDLQTSHLHLRSRGVKWPATAIVDGTIDPTTATIVAAVRAISQVADTNNAENDNNKNETPQLTDIEVKSNTSTATNINTESEIENRLVDYPMCKNAYSFQPDDNKQDIVKSDNSATTQADVNTEKSKHAFNNIQTNDTRIVNCVFISEEKSSNMLPIKTKDINAICNNIENIKKVVKHPKSQADDINFSNDCTEFSEQKKSNMPKPDIETLNEFKSCIQPESQPNKQLNNILNNLKNIDNDYQLSKKTNKTIEEVRKEKKQRNLIDLEINDSAHKSSVNNLDLFKNSQKSVNKSNQFHCNAKQNSFEEVEDKSNNILWITQEKLPNIQTEEDNKINEDYSGFIDEYERNLRQHTCETLDLVDRLCKKSSKQPPEIINLNHTNNNQANKIQWNGKVFSNPTNHNFDIDIDSLCISPNLMANPIDCLMLPDRRLIILDNELGILLVNLKTKQVIRSSEASQSTTTKWRYPKCGAYVLETDQILVLAECCSVVQKPETRDALKLNSLPEVPTLLSLLEPKPTDYDFFICRFDAKTLRLESRIEAPKFIRDKIVSQSQLCYVNDTKCLYMAISTPNDAFLYELNANCRWSEVYNRRGRTFSNLVSFAVIGPITELLVLETNKQHVIMLSIYESDVVTQKTIAICEQPNALAIDEQGAVFVFDCVSACIAQHSRIHFDRLHNIALIDRAHCRLAAQDRILAVLVRGFKQLKLYKMQKKYFAIQLKHCNNSMKENVQKWLRFNSRR